MLVHNKNVNPWKLLGSVCVYQNDWIRVREDRVIRPDGQPGIYGVVEVAPSVVVLAADDQDHVVLVGQWRYARAKFSWELPLGGAHPEDHDRRVTAARELREETGVAAAHWESLGLVEACVGVTNDVQEIFVATSLTHVGSQPDPSEQIQTRWVPFPEAVRMVMAGEITECASIAAILKHHVRRHS